MPEPPDEGPLTICPNRDCRLYRPTKGFTLVVRSVPWRHGLQAEPSAGRPERGETKMPKGNVVAKEDKWRPSTGSSRPLSSKRPRPRTDSKTWSLTRK
jgi:hypothetical protein